MTTWDHDGEFVAPNSNDNWGAARIRSRDNPWTRPRMFSLAEQPSSVTFPTLTNVGSGVDIYILDNGVEIDHPEFTGIDSRAVVESVGLYPTEPPQDDGGHGTHVAAIAAGVTYGVAPGARIVAIKVTSSSQTGVESSVAAGLMAVRSHYSVNSNPAVVNMSLENFLATSSLSQTLIDDLHGDGIAMVAAAGNRFEDIRSLSVTEPYPAAFNNVYVAGATDMSDSVMYHPAAEGGINRQNFGSNFGPDIDIWAPGANIVSAWNSTTATSLSRRINGTSMAAPHVAGVMALLLANATAKLTSAAQVNSLYNQVSNMATVARIKGIPSGTTERMLYIHSVEVT